MTSLLIMSVRSFFSFFSFLILLTVLSSWVPGARSSQLGKWLDFLVEPILGPIRRMIYKSPLGGPGMSLDFSPIIAYLILGVLEREIIKLIIIIF